jgi:hypothetical protein
VFIDPLLVEIFVNFEEGSALLLLQGWVQVEHLLLQTPLLIAEPLDLLEDGLVFCTYCHQVNFNLPVRPSFPLR